MSACWPNRGNRTALSRNRARALGQDLANELRIDFSHDEFSAESRLLNAVRRLLLLPVKLQKSNRPKQVTGADCNPLEFTNGCMVHLPWGIFEKYYA